MKTYEDYPLTGIRKTFCGVATFLVYLAGIALTVFVYQMLAEWEWVKHLYIFNIFIFVALVPLPFIAAHTLLLRVRRWFVWLEIGRRKAEVRGFTD